MYHYFITKCNFNIFLIIIIFFKNNFSQTTVVSFYIIHEEINFTVILILTFIIIRIRAAKQVFAAISQISTFVGMRKNQKYTQEQMFQAIERCQQDGHSHMHYCNQSGIPYQTFKYWLKKFKREKGMRKPVVPTFLPVKVAPSLPIGQCDNEFGHITINYPNGTQVSCPVSVPATYIKTLLTP